MIWIIYTFLAGLYSGWALSYTMEEKKNNK